MDIRPIPQIEADVAEIQKKLDIIQKDIAKKGADIERLQNVNAGLIEAILGKPKPPKSVAAQQAFLLQARTQQDGLKRVQASLEGKLKDLERERDLARLYEEVSQYSEQENTFSQEAHAVFSAIGAVNAELEKLDGLIQDFLHHPADHLGILQLLQSKLNGVSYADFFNGEVVPCDSAVNASFLADQAQAFYTMSNGVPPIRDVSKSWQELQSKLMLLSRLAASIVPRSAKYVETPKPIKATPIETDRPPAPFAEINGRPFKWDEGQQRYLPMREKRPATAPWGLVA